MESENLPMNFSSKLKAVGPPCTLNELFIPV
jgi:hypothetical protein